MSSLLKSLIKSDDIDIDQLTPENLAIMQDAFPDESFDTLARFLIAQNGDVDLAVEMLHNHLRWKHEYLPIRKNSIMNELLKEKLYFHGYDIDGHPLLVWRSKNLDPKIRILQEQIDMIIWWVELALKKKMPENKSKFTLLVDRIDATSDNIDLEFGKVFMPFMQANYPERIHKIIVHPTGWIFYWVWGLAQYFVNPVTRAKVVPALDLETVQKYVPNEYIPSTMGGGCTYEFHLEDFKKDYEEYELEDGGISGEDLNSFKTCVSSQIEIDETPKISEQRNEMENK